jgi:ankyrin repeat protein
MWLAFTAIRRYLEPRKHGAFKQAKRYSPFSPIAETARPMNLLDRITTAIARNNLAALRKLITRENANLVEDGFTLLTITVLYDETDPRILQLLVDRGADVNAADDDRQYTALHFAARDQRSEMVKILLDAGAEVDAIDADGTTPLCHCVRSPNTDLEIVKLLLEHGADPKKKNRDGDSPVASARYAEDAELLALLKKAADDKPARGARLPAKKKAAAQKTRTKGTAKKQSQPKKSGDWPREHSRLWKALVPGRGPASSLQGELIRLTGRLADEAFRNGNQNWTKEHANAWKFVGKHLVDSSVFSPEQVREIKGHVRSIIKDNAVVPVEARGSSYYILAAKAVEWCLANPVPIRFVPDPALYSF